MVDLPIRAHARVVRAAGGQVPALDDDRGVVVRRPLLCRLDGGIEAVRHFGAGEHGQLAKVRRNDRDLRAQLLDGVLRVLFQKAIPAGGHHDWVEDYGEVIGKRGKPRLYGLGDLGAAQHADLHRVHLDVVGHGGELLGEKLHGRVVNGPHALGVLRHQGRGHAHPVPARGRDGLQISLNARAARGIRTGDG